VNSVPLGVYLSPAIAGAGVQHPPPEVYRPKPILVHSSIAAICGKKTANFAV